MSRLVAVVTGASGALGTAISTRLIEDGWRVVGLDEKAASVLGDGYDHVSVDLADPASTGRAMRRICQTHPVAGLVNNVGAVRLGRLEEATLEDLEVSVSLNLRCALQCTQAVVPAMRERGFGRIVNIGSRASLGRSNHTVYGAVKAGLVSMTRSWAQELAAAGITANCVAPGPVDTPLFWALNSPDSPDTRRILAAIPAGRLACPEDVAQAVAFFFDRRSAYITAQVLYVCGGLTAGPAQ